MAKQQTPLEVMFSLFKASFGLSHRALAELILSDRPLTNGRPTAQMAQDTSRLSRTVVHSQPGSPEHRYFAGWSCASRRILHALRESGHSGDGIHAAIVIAYTMYSFDCAKDAEAPTPPSSISQCRDDLKHPDDRPAFGLIRVENGLVVGGPYIVEPTPEGTVVGELALEEGAVTDVGPDASARHLRIYAGDGAWYARDLGSRTARGWSEETHTRKSISTPMRPSGFVRATFCSWPLVPLSPFVNLPHISPTVSG